MLVTTRLTQRWKVRAVAIHRVVQHPLRQQPTPDGFLNTISSVDSGYEPTDPAQEGARGGDHLVVQHPLRQQAIFVRLYSRGRRMQQRQHLHYKQKQFAWVFKKQAISVSRVPAPVTYATKKKSVLLALLGRTTTASMLDWRSRCVALSVQALHHKWPV